MKTDNDVTECTAEDGDCNCDKCQNAEQNRNEAAWERSISSYHGGGDVSLREVIRESRNLK